MFRSLALCVSVAVLAACVAVEEPDVHDEMARGAVPAAGAAAVRATACSSSVKANPLLDVECFEFALHEIPGDPLSNTITLPVLRAKAKGQAVSPHPVFLFHGGPGGPVYRDFEALLSTMDADMAALVLGSRAWIVFDQRGVGVATPRLNCPEMAEGETDLSEVARCRERLLAEGIDLGAYSSATAAADIDLIRSALGYDKINIYGVSYGSRLAHTYARLFPGSVRAIVHDAPMRPDNDESVDDAIGIETALRTMVSDIAVYTPEMDADAFWRKFEAGLSSLRHDPVVVDGEVMDDGAAIRLVRSALYVGPLGMEYAPAVMQAVANRRLDLIKHAVESADTSTVAEPVAADRRSATGQWASVDCYEESTFESVAQFERAMEKHGPTVDAYLHSLLSHTKRFDICSHWPSGRAAAVEAEPVNVAAPQLVFTGAFDLSLSAMAGAAIASRSPLAHNIVFAQTGHVQFITPKMPCALDIASQFFDDPHIKPAAGCAAEALIDNYKFQFSVQE